jgi:hypothetical protein
MSVNPFNEKTSRLSGFLLFVFWVVKVVLKGAAEFGFKKHG